MSAAIDTSAPDHRVPVDGCLDALSRLRNLMALVQTFIRLNRPRRESLCKYPRPVEVNSFTVFSGSQGYFGLQETEVPVPEINMAQRIRKLARIGGRLKLAAHTLVLGILLVLADDIYVDLVVCSA